MGIPLVQGRGFGPQDTNKSQKVAVISESMAQRFFPNGSPLGKRFGIDGPESTEQIEVIGVVKDAKYGALTEQFEPMAFYPHSQMPDCTRQFCRAFLGTVECGCSASSANDQRCQSEPANRRRRKSFRSHRAFARAAETRGEACVFLWTARVVARVCRALRRDVVRRGATHERDWHTHGARRACWECALARVA